MRKAKYKQQKDGRYQTKVWDGSYTPEGKKHLITVYSDRSSTDLEKKVNAIKNSVAQRAYVRPTEETFLEYARSWLRVYKYGTSLATQKMYNNIIEKHFILLEGIPLQEIQKLNFQTVINNASEKPRTCQQISLTFRQVIRSAIQDKKLPAGAFNDICDGVTLPRYIANEKRALTPDEKAAIKTADFSPMEKAFVLIIYGTGLRRGEALAQTNFSVNLKKRELTVAEAVAFNENDPFLKETKNGKKRTVPLPGYLAEYLAEYIPAHANPYLFTTSRGRMMTKSSFDKMWASILRKINAAAGGNSHLKVVHGLTAHVFRHNYCTNLCYQIPAISIKKIAYLMGDSEKMVLEVYNHIMDEKENPAEVVETAVAL